MKLNLRLHTKLLIVSLLLLAVPSLIIGILGYKFSKDALNQEGATGLKNNVRMAIEMIDSLDDAVKTGAISLDQAQEMAKIRLLGRRKRMARVRLTKRLISGQTVFLL